MKEKEFEKKQSIEDLKLRRTKLKIIILNLVNTLLLVALFFTVGRLSDKANEVKQFRSQFVASQSENDVGVLKAELENNKQDIQKISDVFVNENRFLDFYSAMSALQENGIILNLNIPVTNPVADSNKQKGLHVSLTVQGSQDQINEFFKYMERLPYIVRPITIDMDVTLENVITLRYVGFLYTDESFSQN